MSELGDVADMYNEFIDMVADGLARGQLALDLKKANEKIANLEEMVVDMEEYTYELENALVFHGIRVEEMLLHRSEVE